MKTPVVPAAALVSDDRGLATPPWIQFLQELVRLAASDADIEAKLNPITLKGILNHQAKGRIANWSLNGAVYLAANLRYNVADTTWNLDDITRRGGLLILTDLGTLQILGVEAGPNPVTPSLMAIFDLVHGDFNAGRNLQTDSGVLKIGGYQVVGPRLGPLTAGMSAPGGVAGATYTVTEQGLINGLLGTVANCVARVNEIEARLGSASGHGLIS